MILQTGPIAPSSLGLWAVTFVLGGLVAWASWLTLRHFNFAVPAHRRLFGAEEDETNDGHLSDSNDRFDSLDDAHAELADEVDDVHDDLRKVEKRQEYVLSNQVAIARELGVDLDKPKFYRDDGSRSSGDD